jgi:hypothetical protein
MAQRMEKTTFWNVSPDKLQEVLTSEQFAYDREKAQGTLETTYKVTSSSEDRLVYEVHTVAYGKGVTGIDKSKRENAVTIYTWNLKAMSCSWVWTGPHGKRAHVWGNLQITASGDGANLTSDFNVDIKVPLIGGKIEKMVMAEVRPGWDRHDNVLRSFCDRA